MMKLLLVAGLAFLGFASTHVSYEGYKVFKVNSITPSVNEYLKELEANPEYDFWSNINKVGDPISVMVSPAEQERFERYLKENEVEYNVEIENVEKVFEEERTYHKSKAALVSGRIAFDQYLSHAQINAYLEEVARSYPHLVTLESIGRSYENRDTKLVRISTDTGSTVRKPTIFIDAGIHAREWIAPAQAIYLIFQLVENYSVNSALLRNVDYVILPLVNPDGYEYSRTTSRLWRKTRSPGSVCAGCDGNRNFDYYWMFAGASSSECSETFAGRNAFSEIETRNLRDAILRESGVVAYLTFHSYGNYFLYPWGWGPTLPDNWQELQSLGDQAAAAIRAVAGTRYTVGSSTNVLYEAAGASDDWAMGVAKIPIVYTIELPGGGTYGFDLPANRILSVVQETFEGVKVVINYVGNR